MRLFAALNLGNQLSLCFGKRSQATGKTLPPLRLIVLGSTGPLPSPNAQEEADGLAGPFIDQGFVKNLGSWIVSGGFIRVDKSIAFV